MMDDHPLRPRPLDPIPPQRAPLTEQILFYLMLAIAGATFLTALVSCARVERTSLDTSPPLLADIQGDYFVSWGPSLGAGKISGDTIAFEPFPCMTDQPTIGGTFEYELDGSFRAELKTLGGDVKVTIEGSFSPEVLMTGTYEVLLFSQPCESGPVEMRK